MAKQEYLIKILSEGIIVPHNFSGPVLTPYVAPASAVQTLLMAGNHVVEVQEDKSERRLVLKGAGINYEDAPKEKAEHTIKPGGTQQTTTGGAKTNIAEPGPTTKQSEKKDEGKDESSKDQSNDNSKEPQKGSTNIGKTDVAAQKKIEESKDSK